MDKIYIGEVEALEVAFERGIEELPLKGKQVLTVPAIATGLPCLILGHDGKGFYTAIYS